MFLGEKNHATIVFLTYFIIESLLALSLAQFAVDLCYNR